LFGNGTVTFIVDESYINIPIKGIVNVIDEDNDEIPNSFAVKDFVNGEFENFREELDGILNGGLGQEGYGFIPGYYTSVNKTLTEN
jgi:rRNA-processing protein FCF1